MLRLPGRPGMSFTTQKAPVLTCRNIAQQLCSLRRTSVSVETAVQPTHKISPLRALPKQNDHQPVGDAVNVTAAVSPEDTWKWDESSDAVRAYTIFLAVLGLGSLHEFWPIAQNTHRLADLPYFISLAVITIYVGAHRGLNAKQRQQISFEAGLLAPVFASGAIFGMYILIKYFPGLSFQTVFDVYFWLLGTIALIGGFAGPLRQLNKVTGLPTWNLSIPEEVLVLKDESGNKLTSGTLSLSDILVCVGAITLATMDLNCHHSNFTLNNLLACTIASDVLQLVGLKSFRVAAVLLAGLLTYDVVWVFGSPLMKVPSLGLVGDNVMLQVATSFSGPTKLLFPKIASTMTEAGNYPFSLLGLGDIAVPGLLLCLALRFDASRSIDMRARGIAAAEAMQEAMESLDDNASGDEIAETIGNAAENAYERVADLELEQRNRTQGKGAEGATNTVFAASDAVLHQRTYFNAALVAYIIGLAIAFSANTITGLGQPALLYLVPMTLGSVALLAVTRREWSRVWTYTDTSTVSPGDKKE